MALFSDQFYSTVVPVILRPVAKASPETRGSYHIKSIREDARFAAVPPGHAVVNETAVQELEQAKERALLAAKKGSATLQNGGMHAVIL
jgi:hypothetical protein